VLAIFGFRKTNLGPVSKPFHIGGAIFESPWVGKIHPWGFNTLE